MGGEVTGREDSIRAANVFDLMQIPGTYDMATRANKSERWWGSTVRGTSGCGSIYSSCTYIHPSSRQKRPLMASFITDPYVKVRT